MSSKARKLMLAVSSKLYTKTMKAAFLKLGSLGDSTSRYTWSQCFLTAHRQD